MTDPRRDVVAAEVLPIVKDAMRRGAKKLDTSAADAYADEIAGAVLALMAECEPSEGREPRSVEMEAERIAREIWERDSATPWGKAHREDQDALRGAVMDVLLRIVPVRASDSPARCTICGEVAEETRGGRCAACDLRDETVRASDSPEREGPDHWIARDGTEWLDVICRECGTLTAGPGAGSHVRWVTCRECRAATARREREARNPWGLIEGGSVAFDKDGEPILASDSPEREARRRGPLPDGWVGSMPDLPDPSAAEPAESEEHDMGIAGRGWGGKAEYAAWCDPCEWEGPWRIARDLAKQDAADHRSAGPAAPEAGDSRAEPQRGPDYPVSTSRITPGYAERLRSERAAPSPEGLRAYEEKLAQARRCIDRYDPIDGDDPDDGLYRYWRGVENGLIQGWRLALDRGTRMTEPEAEEEG